MAASLQVVLLPIAIGGWLNRQFPKQVARASPFAPLLAMTMTVLICGSILAVNAAAVRTAGPRLLASVAALHSGELSSAGPMSAPVLPGVHECPQLPGKADIALQAACGRPSAAHETFICREGTFHGCCHPIAGWC